MGQSKLKLARAANKEARKGTVRLQAIEIRGQMVAYDEKGRAKAQGSGALEPVYLMEADIPAAIVAVIREKFPKLEFVTIEDAPPPASA
jgi:hypothetical protein